MATSNPLNSKWVFWEQSNNQKSYGAGDKEVCEFDTVEDFWKYWSFIPRPSDVFIERKEVDGRTIGGFCLFKKGIKPEWEDVMNKSGSELVCRNIRNLEVADIVWENLVLGLIGETIDEDNNVCGCRIVHKATGKLNLKIEIWFQSRNAEVIDRIKVRMFDVISDGEPSKAFSRGGAPEFVYKVHGDP